MDRSFHGYYLGAVIPAIVGRSVNWRLQVQWAMKNIWRPAFGHRDITDITRADIQAEINKANLRYAPKSVQNAFKVLHLILDLAEADEVIVRNPCLKIRLAPIPETDKKALTFTQLATLLEHSHSLIKPFVILSGGCSLRLSEACGTMISDLDNIAKGEGGNLTVQRQILQVAGICEPTDTLKTPQSYRTIPLPVAMKDALLDCGQVSNVWLCSDSIGGYMKPKNIRRELAKACEAAGLGHYEERDSKNFTVKGTPGEKVQVFIPLIAPHELRHTFISLMENDLEVPSKIVEELSGKASKRRTGGYSHAELAQLQKAMNRYWDRLSTCLTTTAVVKLA